MLRSKIVIPAALMLCAALVAPALAGEKDGGKTQDADVLLRTLDNGLTVVVKENHTAPVVAVRAYVKYTGRIWEGRFQGCGIAHNLEHLVAGGTTWNRTEDQTDETMQRIGGHSNAYTHFNHTCYFINTAADAFDTAVDLISDWLQNCALKPGEIARERETITEEIRRADDRWTRSAHELFYRALFPDHPISVPTLGHLELFRKITREDLMAYYKERYIPQNVVFVVVGDVEGEEAARKVAEAFSGWPRGRERTYVLPEVHRPPGLNWVEDTHPAARTCMVYLGFPTVRLTHPDLFALDVLALVLGHGRSSRIASRVVEQERLAMQAAAYSLTPSYGCGVFTGYLIGLPYKNVKPAVDAILEEIERCKTALVTEEDLERARVQCVAAHVFNRQTAEDQAEDLGYNVMGVNDPGFSETYLEGIRKVTAEQVRDVARRYLSRDRLTVAVMRPPSPEAKAGAKTGKAPAAEGEGETVKMTLKNGLRVLIQRNTASPVVSFQAWCRAGLGAEPEDLNGVNDLTATLLTHGTATRGRMEILDTLERLGAKVESSGGNNTFGLEMDVLREGSEEAFEIFADLLLHPSFPKGEVEKAKMMKMRDILQKRADPDEAPMRVYRARFFEHHPYARLREGTLASIKRIERDDVAAYHERWFHPSNVVMAVFGDIRVGEAKKMVEARFGAWQGSADFEPVEVVKQKTRKEPETVVETSSFGNVHLLVGFQAPEMTVQDRFPMTLMNVIVAGGQGNWIHDALRGREEGLVYSAYGSFWPGLGAGTWYVKAQCAPEKADRVLSIIQENLEKVREEGVGEEALQNAKRACVVGELLYKQTLSGQAQWSALSELYGMGYDFPKTYLEKIERVTAEDVQRVARTYLKNPMILKLVPETSGSEKKGEESK